MRQILRNATRLDRDQIVDKEARFRLWCSVGPSSATPAAATKPLQIAPSDKQASVPVDHVVLGVKNFPGCFHLVAWGKIQ